MNPDTVLATITAVSEALAEGFKFAATEQGQELIKRSLADRDKAEQAIKQGAEWFQKLVTGKLV